jgi:hypothetical protein
MFMTLSYILDKIQTRSTRHDDHGSSVFRRVVPHADEFDPPGPTPSVPSDFCRVAGILALTGDSVIAFEVWMPPQAEW